MQQETAEVCKGKDCCDGNCFADGFEIVIFVFRRLVATGNGLSNGNCWSCLLVDGVHRGKSIGSGCCQDTAAGWLLILSTSTLCAMSLCFVS